MAWINFSSILLILISSLWTHQNVNLLIRDASGAAQISTIQSLGSSLTDKLLIRDYGGLENLIRLTMGDTSILSVTVTDLDGFPVAYLRRDSNRSKPHPVYSSDAINLPNTAEMHRFEDNQTHLLTLWKPVSSGIPIGWIRIEFLDERAQQISSSLFNNLLVILVLVVAGLITLSTIYYIENYKKMHIRQEQLAELSQQKSQEVIRSHVAMMEALGVAIAKRDSDTGEHNYRVTLMAAKLGEALGVHHDEMQKLIVGSFLHDIGKVGTPDSILRKPGRLTEEELRIMRMHVQHGVEMVKGMGWLNYAHDIVAYHHEKWDGTGYPFRLAGGAIPQIARIFAVVDVFDALCSARPYKDPLSLNQVLDLMNREARAHFDPDIFNLFVKIAPKLYEAIEGQDIGTLEPLAAEMVQKYFYGGTGTA